MLLDYLRAMPDHRRGQGRRYDLACVVMCTILAVLSGADSYRSIHTFMEMHFRLLKGWLGFAWKRAPAYTHLREILVGIAPATLEAAFRSYSAAVAAGLPQGFCYLACDGKTLRGSFDHLHDRKAAELLSVFAVDSQLIVAQVEIPDKTNEIPAFQALVKELGLSGKLFTLDALHAQKNTASRKGQWQRRRRAGQG